MDITANLRQVNEEIQQACAKNGRDPDNITIIGVTKYVTIARAEEAIDAGISHLGENRLEGFLEKHAHIQNRASWHFIGTLQSKKVKDVIDKVAMIHSLDRMSLAREINKRASEPIDCFVQVNISGEETKHGLRPEDTLPFIKELEALDNVRVVGLMTMAPAINDKEQLRELFRDMASLRNAVQAERLPYAPCSYLSMGMSNDYQLAVEEGATHIRIGSKLVGS